MAVKSLLCTPTHVQTQRKLIAKLLDLLPLSCCSADIAQNSVKKYPGRTDVDLKDEVLFSLIIQIKTLNFPLHLSRALLACIGDRLTHPSEGL